MSVYARYKRDPEGFRKLVELLESTPKDRRQKLIDVGMEEDPAYTEKAVSYIMTFEDVMKLPDGELAEVIAETPPSMVGYAFGHMDQTVKERVLKCAPMKLAVDVRDALDAQVDNRARAGAQGKMVQVTRTLERDAKVNCKKIPPKI